VLRLFSVVLLASFCISVVGCGGSSEVNIKTPPPIGEAKRIVIAPFYAEVGLTEEVSELARRISVNLATRFELIVKDSEWVYDISDKVKPVKDKLAELGVTVSQIYADPALAAKLGEALGADMVIVGRVGKPSLTQRDYQEHLMRQGRQAGIAGTSTYIRTRLTATGRVRVKVVNTGSGQLIFNNRIRSYLKYWYAYQTQQSGQQIFKSEADRFADLGKHLPLRIAYILHPTGVKVEEGQILLKPDIKLKGTGGLVDFN